MKKTLLLLFLVCSFFTFGQATVNTNSQINKTVTISDTNDSYLYKANFKSNKTSTIRKAIVEQFGEAKSNDTDLVWTWNGSYEINLHDGNVTISFGKSNDNKELYEKIKTLGSEISSIIKK